jgi:hypothetical protein
MGEQRAGVTGKYLLAVALLLTIAAIGYMAYRYVVKPPTRPNVDEGRAVAEAFLNSLRGGKPGEAWDATTTEFKSIEGRESFIRKVNSTPLLKGPLQFNSSHEALVQDEPRTEYLFQSPDAKMIRVLIGYERGNWKVDRLTL